MAEAIVELRVTPFDKQNSKKTLILIALQLRFESTGQKTLIIVPGSTIEALENKVLRTTGQGQKSSSSVFGPLWQWDKMPTQSSAHSAQL